MNAKRFYPTAIALYFTYFIHGIGVSILGQYKQDFAGVWEQISFLTVHLM